MGSSSVTNFGSTSAVTYIATTTGYVVMTNKEGQRVWSKDPVRVLKKVRIFSVC